MEEDKGTDVKKIEEEVRRRISATGTSDSTSGMGETQQAQSAMMESQEKAHSEEEMSLQGPAEKQMYPAGTGGHYPSSPDAPLERVSTGEPFTSGPMIPSRSEEKANQAGETIGRALRKVAVIGKELGSGLRKGLGREK